MSRAARAVIAAFEELPPADREKVIGELLRRVALSEHSSPADDELAVAAGQVFETLDRRETPSR